MMKPFDYQLPERLIAQYPLKERDNARLMILDKGTGRIRNTLFSDIPGSFAPGDALVLNNSRVIPARILCRRPTGGRTEVFLLRKRCGSSWNALVRGGAKEGQVLFSEALSINGARIEIRIIENLSEGCYVVDFATNDDEEIFSCGQVPLPPYIKRGPVDDDRSDYQTVYARKDGSVAAHTAGLHFTREMIESISGKGVEIVYITLHMGWPSFKLTGGTAPGVGEEYLEITPEASYEINRVKKAGRKVFAVGTSSARALESAALQGEVLPMSGNTSLFISPGYEFDIVDALITNFHLPGSTHLLLVSAFAGTGYLKKAYESAVKMEYRFYSYGDAMLIL